LYSHGTPHWWFSHTVSFHDPIQEKGTGFSFDRYEPLDLFTCMIRTWESFRYKQDWQKLQQRAMTQDFSWYNPLWNISKSTNKSPDNRINYPMRKKINWSP